MGLTCLKKNLKNEIKKTLKMELCLQARNCHSLRGGNRCRSQKPVLKKASV